MQLTTQLRVVFRDNLEQTLVDEASALGATLLILSTSRRHVAPWYYDLPNPKVQV